eukprot:scaffold243914_cov26-Tisochrysis_lutea.AAC.1
MLEYYGEAKGARWSLLLAACGLHVRATLHHLLLSIRTRISELSSHCSPSISCTSAPWAGLFIVHCHPHLSMKLNNGHFMALPCAAALPDGHLCGRRHTGAPCLRWPE